MNMRILKGLGKLEYIRLDHWLNMVEHTCNRKKIEQANVI